MEDKSNEVVCPRCGRKHKISPCKIYFGDQTICSECRNRRSVWNGEEDPPGKIWNVDK